VRSSTAIDRRLLGGSDSGPDRGGAHLLSGAAADEIATSSGHRRQCRVLRHRALARLHDCLRASRDRVRDSAAPGDVGRLLSASCRRTPRRWPRASISASSAAAAPVDRRGWRPPGSCSGTRVLCGDPRSRAARADGVRIRHHRVEAGGHTDPAGPDGDLDGLTPGRIPDGERIVHQRLPANAGWTFRSTGSGEVVLRSAGTPSGPPPSGSGSSSMGQPVRRAPDRQYTLAQPLARLRGRLMFGT
jgi:hypothetical protein